MIYWLLNPEKIWHQQLVHLPTLPVNCSHFTLGKSIKVIFSSHSYTRTSDYLRYLRSCCTAAYLFTYCLLLPIICVALFYGQFFVYLVGQSFSKPPMPTHNRLFSE